MKAEVSRMKDEGGRMNSKKLMVAFESILSVSAAADDLSSLRLPFSAFILHPPALRLHPSAFILPS